MNPHVLFWIPAALRLAIIWIGSAVLWYFFGPVVGLLAGLVLTTAITVSQLYYLSALDIWLDSPRSDRLPDGWGAWHAVYSHLYRLSHEEEKSKKELTEWLTRFREAMSFLPDGVAIMENVLFLEWCNPMAEKHLGLDLERDKDMRITNLVRNPAFIDYVVLGRYDEPLEMTFNDRFLLLQIIPFGNRRQILVTHDKTDSVRTEKIRRDFVANASHELRTPLTVINGFLEVALANPDLDRETRLSHLTLMKEQGERMQSLGEGMLTLTNLESDDYPLNREPFNAIELAAWTHAEFVRIHPFVDGNGRTSRMIMNYQLMAQGFLPVSIAKENRLEYFDALEAYAVNGDLQPFADMVAELEEQRLGEYLSIAQEQIQNNGPAMTL